MTDTQGAGAAGHRRQRSGTSFRLWTIVGLSLIAIAALAAGYWYWTARQPPATAAAGTVEPPFYLDLKPFVVSVTDSSGTPHFVQLGLSLALSQRAAGIAVESVMPEILEAMRETVLAFRVEDIVNRAGVDRLRQAIVAAANRVLLQRLGAAEVKRLAAGASTGGIVQNAFLPTLIVE
jgi:flagellar basal body-associated protein FliL